MNRRRLFFSIIIILAVMPAAAQIGAEDFVYLQPSKEIAMTNLCVFYTEYVEDVESVDPLI